MMRVLLVAESIGTNRFGVAQVVLDIMKILEQKEIPFRVITSKVGDVQTKNISSIIKTPPVLLKGQIGAGLQKFLRRQIDTFKPDIVHVHGVFMLLHRAAIKVATDSGDVQTLLSVHGMLEPWMWHQGKPHLYTFFKRIFWQVYIHPHLKKTSYLHAITSLEAKHLHMEFPGIPQIRISNAIKLPVQDLSEIPDIRKRIVFLGRLHPKKGVDLLLQSFAKAQLASDWRLVIAGPSYSPGYVAYLKTLSAELGIDLQVSFIGPIYGRDKFVLLQQAWIVVVPSYSEVVGLVNLEAGAVRTPTITTTLTGLEDWEESGGLLISPNVNELAGALRQVTSWPLAERIRRGNLAYAHIAAKHSLDVIQNLWIKAYEQIITQ